jgi:hypothetical protein
VVVVAAAAAVNYFHLQGTRSPLPSGFGNCRLSQNIGHIGEDHNGSTLYVYCRYRKYVWGTMD